MSISIIILLIVFFATNGNKMGCWHKGAKGLLILIAAFYALAITLGILMSMSA